MNKKEAIKIAKKQVKDKEMSKIKEFHR